MYFHQIPSSPEYGLGDRDTFQPSSYRFILQPLGRGDFVDKHLPAPKYVPTLNSTESERMFRSPLLMNADDSALIVIDVQDKLVPHIPNYASLTWNISRLIRGAQTLKVPVRATEQYPKGLGPTTASLLEMLELDATSAQPVEKLMFSCRECGELFSELSDNSVHNLLLCGIETHVCVAQTALDMVAAGFNVYLAVDATGSRFDKDQQIALRRLEASGVTLTTTEAALFEWCEKAGSDSFKMISKLVQESAPETS